MWYLHVRHGREVVNLCWLDIHHDAGEASSVRQVAVVKNHFCFLVGERVFVQVFDSPRVERRRSANDAMDLEEAGRFMVWCERRIVLAGFYRVALFDK